MLFYIRIKGWSRFLFSFNMNKQDPTWILFPVLLCISSLGSHRSHGFCIPTCSSLWIWEFVLFSTGPFRSSSHSKSHTFHELAVTQLWQAFSLVQIIFLKITKGPLQYALICILPKILLRNYNFSFELYWKD